MPDNRTMTQIRKDIIAQGIQAMTTKHTPKSTLEKYAEALLERDRLRAMLEAAEVAQHILTAIANAKEQGT